MQRLPRQYKTGVVFGVFDRLHDGHRDFLRQASDLADECVAIVARDSAVLALKNKKPCDSEAVRLASVRAVAGVVDVVLGDAEQGAYTVLKNLKPDVILLGYDQNWLERDLKEKMTSGALSAVPLARLDPYKPEQFHTSIIQQIKAQ